MCCERNCKPKGTDDLGYAEATDSEKIARQKIGNKLKKWVFFLVVVCLGPLPLMFHDVVGMTSPRWSGKNPGEDVPQAVLQTIYLIKVQRREAPLMGWGMMGLNKCPSVNIEKTSKSKKQIYNIWKSMLDSLGNKSTFTVVLHSCVDLLENSFWRCCWQESMPFGNSAWYWETTSRTWYN